MELDDPIYPLSWIDLNDHRCVFEPMSSTVYQALVGVVTPRPIAWVTTLDGEGRVNLAPFSFFNAFGANPPVVVFSPTLRRDGSKKDTLLNLEAVPEFVLNAAVEDLAEQVNATSTSCRAGRARRNTRA